MASEARVQIDAVLQPVGEALDHWAWRKLMDSHPELALAVEAAVARGAQPRDIRRYVIEHTQQAELAGFVEQAARWLARGS